MKNLFKKMKSKYVKACTFAFVFSFSIIKSAYADPTATAPGWLDKTNVSAILTEPMGWLMWLSGVGGPLLIAINGMKYKSANGNTQKMEDAMKGMKTTAIGAVIVFSAAGIGHWFFGKLGMPTAG